MVSNPCHYWAHDHFIFHFDYFCCLPLRADSGSSNEQNLLRLCDMHSVPIATNIATAEVLLRGMDQGDLDYREGMHPPVIEPLAAPRRAVC